MRRRWVAAVIMLASAWGCSGDDSGDTGAESGPAGGGQLILNGAGLSLTAATCVLGDDTFDSSAFGPDGLRVFASQSNPIEPVRAEILDAEGIRWFPRDVQGDEAARDGGTITSPTHTWFNEQDDLTIGASFTIECP